MKYSEISNLSDSHFHILEMQKKGLDINDFFENWITSNGKFLIDIGIDENNLEERFLFSDKKNLYYSVGIHPNSASSNLKDRMILIEKSINNNKVIAIGETGLDYYWNNVDKSVQKEFFIAHIELSIKYNLPLVIHNRDASEDIISILKSYNGNAKGVIHCYSSNKLHLKEFIDLGFYISYAGNITYKNNKELQSSISFLPLDKLLIETDSPYLSPTPLRGKINTPLNIFHTFNFILSYFNIDENMLKNKLNSNLIKLFNIQEDL